VGAVTLPSSGLQGSTRALNQLPTPSGTVKVSETESGWLRLPCHDATPRLYNQQVVDVATLSIGLYLLLGGAIPTGTPLLCASMNSLG
jgi:hypothetical protein